MSDLSNLCIAVPVYIPLEEPERGYRLDYFRQFLFSLRHASRVWPCIFSVEGDIVAASAMINDTDFYQKPLVLVRGESPNLALNSYFVYSVAFDRLRHDPVFYVESDILLAPDILPLLGNLLDWSRARSKLAYPSILSSSIVKYSESPNDILLHLTSWTNVLVPRAAWQAIREPLRRYNRIIKNQPYGRFSPEVTQKVQDWIQRVFNMPNEVVNQDNIRRILCHKLGIPTWSLACNRAIHIGQYGINSTPENTLIDKPNPPVIHSFPHDPDIHDFVRLGLTAEEASHGHALDS